MSRTVLSVLAQHPSLWSGRKIIAQGARRCEESLIPDTCSAGHPLLVTALCVLRDLCASAMKMAVPKAPWTAAARRRLCRRPCRDIKAASSRRSPRCFAHFHAQWRAGGSWKSVVKSFLSCGRQSRGTARSARSLLRQYLC